MPERKWKVGDRVRFAHIPERLARTYEIQGIRENGFLRVNRLAGWYSPHLFVEGGEKVPNVIQELQMELVRVRRILHRLDPVERAKAGRILRGADESMAMNSLEGMKEAISDLQEIKTEKQKK